MKLENRKAVVTGGAQGIGEALATRLANEGADVVIMDLNLELAEKTAAAIRAESGRAVSAVKVNVTVEEEVERAMAEAAGRMGGLDIFINNAGIVRSGYIADFPKKDWDLVLDINLTGAFHCIKHASRYMIEGKKGSMVVIASRSGKRGGLWNHAYCASKFGVIGLVQCVAMDLAPLKIRINAICPGNALDTPLWKDLAVQYSKKYHETPEETLERYRKRVPLGRGCDVADIANLATFLLSEDSSYMTGQAINLTGGEVMSP